MEYFLGSIATMLVMLLAVRILKRKSVRVVPQQSQSKLFEITKNTDIVIELLYPKVKTQAMKHHESNIVRVIFAEQQAYWIKDSVFYTADIDGLGFVDVDSTRAVDTMAMDKVQLDKMSFIVEKLTEGK